MRHGGWVRARNALAAVVLTALGCTPVWAQLFELDGRAYRAEDLSVKLQRLMYRVEAERHAALAELVDEALFELYLDREARSRGESRADVAARALAVDEPTSAEVERFYADNAGRINGALEDVRPAIVRHLRSERLERAKASLVASLKRDAGFRPLLEKPPPPPVELDITDHPVRGPVDARITLVEFGDYQCPRCRRAAATLRRVLELYPDDVRLVYLDFPINRSGISRRVAEGAVCADAQGRFWEYHDLAFERQPGLDHDSPGRLARSLGLDAAAFASCLEGDEPARRVVHAERQARALGIVNTPAVYVDGHPLETSHLERTLVELIDARLGRGG